MSATTLIKWTRSTWSPWLGCRKVSEGCINCYITGTTPFRTRNLVHGGRREYLSKAYWKQPIKWDREAMRDGRRHRVFPSLCDWLDDEVPIEHLASFLELIRRTPHIDWQLLTKRPQNWKARMEAVQQYATDNNLLRLGCFVSRWWLGTAPNNAWIGVSTENQRWADERIPLMFEIPAVLYFISAEPLLGPIDLRPLDGKKRLPVSWLEHGCAEKRIDWVITGGESSRRLAEQPPRPAHPNWFRFLRKQCAAAKVPFFFKQWGDWAGSSALGGGYKLAGDFKVHTFDDGTPEFEMVFRIGKEKAGNLLDGRTHEEMPEVARA